MAFISEPHFLQTTFSRSGIGSPLSGRGPNATPSDPIVPPEAHGVLLSAPPLELTAIADRALHHTFVFGPGFKCRSHFFGDHESPTDISIFRTGIERN